MENEKFTPQGWHWKITPEQIEKIKQGDIDTVNQVYFDNLDKIKRLAYTFCVRWRKRLHYFEDCVQQVYSDLLEYDFTDTKTLFWSIRHSFARAIGSTRIKTVSLDEPILHDENGSCTLLDFLADSYGVDTVSQEIAERENAQKVLAIISAQTELTERDKDMLTAYSFGCHPYRGLFVRVRQIYSY